MNPEKSEPQPIPITFALFLSSLVMQAFVALGELPHPVTGQKSTDLTQAQQTIDLLTLLKEKTRGNLSTEEDHLLSSSLYELQLKYVKKASPS